MKIKLLIPFFALTALTIASCKKESDGSGKVSYKINPTNFTASVLSSTKDSHSISEANTITWTSGNISISEIDFEAKKEGMEGARKGEIPDGLDISSLCKEREGASPHRCC